VAKALAEQRLVTLLGPGGIGKTRLATVAAQRAAEVFTGGGAFVDLVPVSADFLVQAVAAALGVVERPREPLHRVVHERLRAGRCGRSSTGATTCSTTRSASCSAGSVCSQARSTSPPRPQSRPTVTPPAPSTAWPG